MLTGFRSTLKVGQSIRLILFCCKIPCCSYCMCTYMYVISCRNVLFWLGAKCESIIDMGKTWSMYRAAVTLLLLLGSNIWKITGSSFTFNPIQLCTIMFGLPSVHFQLSSKHSSQTCCHLQILRFHLGYRSSDLLRFLVTFSIFHWSLVILNALSIQ